MRVSTSGPGQHSLPLGLRRSRIRACPNVSSISWSATVSEIILALDVPTPDAAYRLLDRVPGARWVKVGSVLFTAAGPALIGECRVRGLQVFLDLKWHDIPNTVAGAVRAARELQVSMATVHTLGGPDMMAAAAEAAAGSMLLVGVTVLTSHTPESYARAVGRASMALEPEVARLAAEAGSAGLSGVVCSPHEVKTVAGILASGATIVVPGIRRPGDAVGDQARSAGPADAARAGATHLVVGRPILQAPDPAQVLAEMTAAAAG
jgi:orotidine-5'-phosphate decarboxylase